MAGLVEDVSDYEKWLRERCSVVEKDLDTKHSRMASDAFMFLRATYFRWAHVVPQVCPKLLKAPAVLCVGDIHVENYGTWRDADGRQVWGVNDFDEAAVMPYTLDLLRLTCSACLIPGIELSPHDVAARVLDGYQRGLSKPGPILLSEGPSWYRKVSTALVDSWGHFWERFEVADAVEPPTDVVEVLLKSMPTGTTPEKYTSVVRGGGSLGRPRYQLVGTWQGGKVLREVKSVLPSAWYWATQVDGAIHILDLANGTYRSPDPTVAIHKEYMARRISPSSRKLDLADVGGVHVVRALLGDMGRELGSIHRTDAGRKNISADLTTRKGKWLTVASEAMLDSVRADFATWSSHWQRQAGHKAAKKRARR